MIKINFESFKNGNIYNLVAEYSYEYDDDSEAYRYIFKIFEKGRENEDSFDFMLREMENGTDLKVVALFADNNNYYLGKGISISIILKAKELFGKKIISSSNSKQVTSGESISELAISKVWKPLVESGKAKYCETEHHYYLL